MTASVLLAFLFLVTPAIQAQGTTIRITVECGDQGIVDADFELWLQFTDADGTTHKIMAEVPDSSDADAAALAVAAAVQSATGAACSIDEGELKTAYVTLPDGCTILTGEGNTYIYKARWTEDLQKFHAVGSGQVDLDASDASTPDDFEEVPLTNLPDDVEKKAGESPPQW